MDIECLSERSCESSWIKRENGAICKPNERNFLKETGIILQREVLLLDAFYLKQDFCITHFLLILQVWHCNNSSKLLPFTVPS